MKFLNILFSFLCLIISHLTFAQIGNSPYSRIGVGDLSDQNMIYNMGMGGVGASNSTPLYMNNVNPALLGRHKLTSFDAGVFAEYKILNSQNTEQRTQIGNINYLSFAFPINKRWTTGIGFMPYSNVNYTSTFDSLLSGTSTFVKYTYRGSGGITQLYWSNGVQVLKELYLGLRINYNFGAIRNQSQSELNDGQNIYIVELLDRANVGDFSFKPAAAYRLKIGKETHLNFGVVYDMKAGLNITQFKATQRRNISDVILYADTSINQKIKNAIVIPSALKIGVGIDKYLNYNVSTDITLQDWSQYRGFINTNANLTNSFRWNIGAEWIPNIDAIEGYFNRVAYRAGFNYAKTPIIINGKQLEDMSASFGLSLPMSKGVSSLNLAFIAGQRGTTDANLVKERYFRVNLGMTVNDQWFLRRKIN
jgi:hypothetical protein